MQECWVPQTRQLLVPPLTPFDHLFIWRQSSDTANMQPYQLVTENWRTRSREHGLSVACWEGLFFDSYLSIWTRQMSIASGFVCTVLWVLCRLGMYVRWMICLLWTRDGGTFRTGMGRTSEGCLENRNPVFLPLSFIVLRASIFLCVLVLPPRLGLVEVVLVVSDALLSGLLLFGHLGRDTH